MNPTSAAVPPRLETAPTTLSAWTSHVLQADIPVLADTAAWLEGLRANEDDADANSIGEAVANDPLMSLKILAHVATHRRGRVDNDPETVISALVLMGIGPFFRTFGPQPTLEERLADRPEALRGAQEVLRRSSRAARFALGFAVHRMDPDAAVIHQAALLHDFAEVLLWCHAPDLALEIVRRQADDPSLRSSQVQRQVLHIELNDLQQALMRAWHLPELLVHISNDKAAHSPQVRNVTLAIRLARHSAQGWDNPALPDDIADLAQLLNLGFEPTRHLVIELDG